MFHIFHPAYGVTFNYISKCKILHKIFLKTVVKTCENDFSSTILNNTKNENRVLKVI